MTVKLMEEPCGSLPTPQGEMFENHKNFSKGLLIKICVGVVFNDFVFIMKANQQFYAKYCKNPR